MSSFIIHEPHIYASHKHVDSDTLPICVEAIGILKSITCSDEELNEKQIDQVRMIGNETDGKYVWNRSSLQYLLDLNIYLFESEQYKETIYTNANTVEGFINLIKNNEVKDPVFSSLINVAFLDTFNYNIDEPVIVPDNIANFIEDANVYGLNLTLDEIWEVALISSPENWSRTFRMLNRLKR